MRWMGYVVAMVLVACNGDGDDGGEGSDAADAPGDDGTAADGEGDGGDGNEAPDGGDDGATGGASGDDGEDTTGGNVTSDSADEQGAEGLDGPCFDGEDCISVLDIFLPEGTEAFTLMLDINPSNGTVSCPDGATTGWLMTGPDVTCNGGSGVTISGMGFKFPGTVTIAVDDGEPMEYTPGFEDNLGGCISQCNQAELQL